MFDVSKPVVTFKFSDVYINSLINNEADIDIPTAVIVHGTEKEKKQTEKQTEKQTKQTEGKKRNLFLYYNNIYKNRNIY